MVGQFFKSLGLMIPLALIGGIYYGTAILMIQIMQENWTAILVLFGIFFFLTYIFTKVVGLIWRGMNYMYHFWILAVTVAMYIVFMTQQEKMDNPWLYYIVFEFTLLFFIIPECTSYWTHYLVTEYIDDVEVDHYFTKEYTSGTLTKIGFMALGTAIFSLITLCGGQVGFIISFAGHCLYLFVLFIRGLVGFVRS